MHCTHLKVIHIRFMTSNIVSITSSLDRGGGEGGGGKGISTILWKGCFDNFFWRELDGKGMVNFAKQL